MKEKKGYYDERITNHSWGEALGISRTLIFIANELHELNKSLKKIYEGGGLKK